MKPKMNSDGYLMVSLQGPEKDKMLRLNVAVAQAFIPNPENKPFVDHRNSVPWDNREVNLRWATAAENKNFSFGRAVNDGETMVIQKCDLVGNVLKEYPSICAVKADGYGSKVVNRVVLGQRNTAYGFIWKRVIVFR